MTTIAYHHKDKTVAVDSRVSCGTTIECDDFDKTITTDEGVWVLAGAVCEIQELINLEPGQPMANPEAMVSGFLVADGEVLYIYVREDGSVARIPTTYSCTGGSGKDFALSSLDFGKSAVEAVKYACTRDLYSGGAVRVVDVETGEVKRVDAQ